MYKYIFHRLKHIFRFRHKRGYGVHSPFVYDLITAVIREKAEYYAFEQLELQQGGRGKRKKLYRLLYRLAEYKRYRQVLFIGMEADDPARYLAAVSAEMALWNVGRTVSCGRCCNVASPGELSGESLDLIYLGGELKDYWNADWEQFMRDRRSLPLCVVVTEIHHKKPNGKVWRSLKKESTVSVDMMWYGLLFFDGRLQRGKYNLKI